MTDRPPMHQAIADAATTAAETAANKPNPVRENLQRQAKAARDWAETQGRKVR